jgi:hypothetical protein
MPIRLTKRRRAPTWHPSPKLAKLLAGSGVDVGAVKKPRGKPEHIAQAALFKDHIWVRLVPDCVAFAIPNGGHRHKKVAEELKEEGLTPGAPDIFLLHEGQAYFLEMKSLTGSLEPEQKIMLGLLTSAGAICAVCKGLDKAIKQLEAWGLLMMTTEEMAA